jgi:hypothetical protein
VKKYVSELRWFSPGTPVSSTNKTDRHAITEILLRVALNTINPVHNQSLNTFSLAHNQEFEYDLLGPQSEFEYVLLGP